MGFVIVLEVGLLTDFLSLEEADILEVLLRVDWIASLCFSLWVIFFLFNPILFSREVEEEAVGEGGFVSSIKGMSPAGSDIFCSAGALHLLPSLSALRQVNNINSGPA